MTDKRNHQRYLTLPAGTVDLILGTSKLKVKDLSYGGMLIGGIPDGAENTTVIHAGSLIVLGDRIDIKFKIVYYSKITCGAAFVHDTPTTLLFLRTPLEWMRCGRSLTKVDPAALDDRYRTANILVYRGDLQTDLTIQAQTPGTKDIVRINFRIGEDYKQVEIVGSKISSASMTKTEALHPVSRGVSTDDEIDRHTMRCAAAILIGAQQLGHASLESALHTLIAKLR